MAHVNRARGSARAEPSQADPERLPWSGRLVLLAFAFAFWWFQALTGFTPTDDGFVLAQSRRLLQGEVPHLDFTSPRPVGSAFLHLPELLLPVGTVAASRLVVVLQLLWIAVATVSIAGRKLALHPTSRVALVLLAFIVNVGAWPIMAWHTIDGLFVGITAIWLAVRCSETSGRLWWLVWLLAGTAPLMKQGFVIVPVVVALVSARRGASRSPWTAAPFVFVPPLAYWLMTIRTPGGLRSQLDSGSARDLLEPLHPLWHLFMSREGMWVLLGAAIASASARASLDRPVARFALGAIALMSPVVWMGWRDSFALLGSWPDAAALQLILVAIFLARDRTRVNATIAVLALGYAASLSWGVPVAGLTAGSCLAVSLVLCYAQTVKAPLPVMPSRTPATALAVVAIVTVAAVWQARNVNEYEQPKASQLTAHARTPALALIRMSPAIAAYVDLAESCVTAHPAREVAVLPGSPGFFAVLKLRNPFDTDWWTPREEPADFQQRVDTDVARLNASRNWLVLWSGVNPAEASTLTVKEVTSATPTSAPLLDQLAGSTVQCGSLSGKYRAP